MPVASSRQRHQSGPLTSAARTLAHRVLVGEPSRLEHSSGVARAATYAAQRLPDVPVDVVVAAAWLHDIGHARALARTGFHPLDGAHYLEQLGWDDLIVRLVAHHSHSAVAAEVVGAGNALARFEPPRGLVPDLLTFADVIAGPDGRGTRVPQPGSGPAVAPVVDDREQSELAHRRLLLLEESVTSVCAVLLPGDMRTARSV